MAGLITTNSISQLQNRQVTKLGRDLGANVVWAIADHPWVDSSDGADVRVALTVQSISKGHAILLSVDANGRVVERRVLPRLNSDLTADADIASAAVVELLANIAVASTGFKLHGSGFILSAAEAEAILTSDPVNAAVVRPYLNGRDLAQRPRGVYVIDFASMSEAEAREFPVVFDIVRARVKPERDANNDSSRRTYWWRFGRTNEQLRSALAGLATYIVTPETAKHRFFTRCSSAVAPDNMLTCIATDDGSVLGVLSSRLHVAWALAAGGRLGVGNDPRYNKNRCFDSFPFPTPPNDLRTRIATLAERLDTHRKDALARDERVTMTGMYNIVEKLRSGEALTPKERSIHEIAACGVLRDLHDELDALVAEAYGWPWPMAREEILKQLVALHDERVAEEKRRLIRWLRPEYQIPRFAPTAPVPAELALVAAAREVATVAEVRRPWPTTAVEQLAAVAALVAQGPRTLDETVASFSTPKREQAARHLETLALMGEVVVDDAGRYGSAVRVG